MVVEAQRNATRRLKKCPTGRPAIIFFGPVHSFTGKRTAGTNQQKNEFPQSNKG